MTGPSFPSPSAVPASPEVAILMGLHTGARYLQDQLLSLEAQDHRAWSLTVSDDGDPDGSAEILSEFERATGRAIERVTGPRKGFALNFLSLLTRSDPGAPYLAFCDQDDWWLPGKLSRAVAALAPISGPALYGGRTVLCDPDLGPRHLSPHFRRGPSFENALVQSIAGGNTMVMNRAAVDLLRAAGQGLTDIVAHDWWAYQVVSGAGGRVIYDPTPLTLYRQHGRNHIGGNRSPLARLSRVAGVVDGRLAGWTDRTLTALSAHADLLTPEARRTLDTFAGVRDRTARRRLKAFHKSGVHRQARSEDVALRVAAGLGTL